jgi:hypothetical protein
VALGSGVDDATYLAALRETLPSVLSEHRPVIVFYLAGADPAADDRLGDWRISADGMLTRDRFVLDALRAQRPDLPVVSMLQELKGRRLLEGLRGRPPADRKALARAIAALSRFAAAHAGELESIDINPLLALPDRALALDALIVRR